MGEFERGDDRPRRGLRRQRRSDGAVPNGEVIRATTGVPWQESRRSRRRRARQHARLARTRATEGRRQDLAALPMAAQYKEGMQDGIGTPSMPTVL